MSYKVEIDSEYRGYRYVVTFGSHAHRCGYVGITSDNPFYGKDYTDNIDILKRADVENKPVGKRGVITLLGMALSEESEHICPVHYFDVHWSLTYSGGGEGSKYPVESDLWWYGFDCGHCEDGSDYSQAFAYGLISEQQYNSMAEIERLYPTNEPVRSTEYVEQECKNLIDQIISVLEKREVQP
jgi:hypothetical protein